MIHTVLSPESVDKLVGGALAGCAKYWTNRGFHALHKVWADCVCCPVGSHGYMCWHPACWGQATS